MCEKKQFKYCPSEIDECMTDCVNTLECMSLQSNVKSYGSCCGHGRYSKTIVMGNKAGTRWELLTGILIPRKKKFYKKDSRGYYFIPEVDKVKK